MINITGNTARKRALAHHLRQQIVLERGMVRTAHGLFARQGAAAARVYAASADESAALFALQAFDKEVLALLTGHYTRVAEAFGGEVLAALKSAHILLETKDALGMFRTNLLRWNRQQGAAKVTRLQDATRRILQAAIRRGFRASETQEGIAKRILQRVGDFGSARARVVARTETHNEANFAQLEAAKSTSVVQEKEWLSAEDSRTRESHAEADGQRRPLKESFDVGGSKLDRPGDPGGSAGEIINCRCTMIMHTG